MKKKYAFVFINITILLLCSFCMQEEIIQTPKKYSDVIKLEYNNPGLVVDLDVGFKSVPMPMDFDGDGDLDLLVSESSSYVESGVFYFENISSDVNAPLFRYGMEVSSERFRLGDDGKCFVVSLINEHIHVITPDNVSDKLLMYEDVPENVFWKKTKLSIPAKGYIKDTKKSVWKMIDFDGDNKFDLVCGLSSKKGSYLLFFKNKGTNEQPDYLLPKKIKDIKGNPIGMELSLEVPFADYDNDGDLDYLALGNFGNIIYFANTGSKKKYVFNEGIELTRNSQRIQFVSRAGGIVRPRAIDFNKDGNIDIIAGDEDGKVSFLKNTGILVDGIPQFEQPIFFQQEARYVDYGALTTPRMYDWDGDGLDDIICGNGVGNIGFIKNLSRKQIKWDKPKHLKANGKEILILPKGANWGYTTIDVGNWNEDNLPDILVNDHNGNVVWFENIGTRTNPMLASSKPIKVQWEGEPQKPEWVPGISNGNELLAPWRTSPFIMDFNSDGLSDLVMLDYQGYLAVYLRYKDGNNLLLKHPERNFIYESGESILLNQLIKSSSGRLKITFADWDGDGLEDLVFSSKPAVDWMRNKGMKDGKIVLEYMGRVISRTLMGHTDGPVVTDLNSDGIPDLLVGTETGAFYYWERPSFGITSTMTTAGKQKPANYKYFKR